MAENRAVGHDGEDNEPFEWRGPFISRSLSSLIGPLIDELSPIPVTEMMDAPGNGKRTTGARNARISIGCRCREGEGTRLVHVSLKRKEDRLESIFENISFRFLKWKFPTIGGASSRLVNRAHNASSTSSSFSLLLSRRFDIGLSLHPREAHQLMEMRSSDENDINQNICL